MAKQQQGGGRGGNRGGYQRQEGTRNEPKRMTPAEFEAAFKKFVDDLNRYKSQVRAVLPATTSFEKFRSVIIMAIRKTPRLLECTPTSLINACIHSAHDGLLPDGRLAVIVPVWNNSDKLLEANYRSMVAGIIQQMIVAGGTVTKVQPFVVYQGEEFDIVGGSDPTIYHKIEPDGSKRGEIRGVYAVAGLKEGGSTWSYMTKEQVEEIRKTAQTDVVWKAHWEEMALKTVIRRLRKRIPGMQDIPDMDQALTYLSIAGEQRAPSITDAGARPTRQQFLEHTGGEAGTAMDFGGGWADQREPVETAPENETANQQSRSGNTGPQGDENPDDKRGDDLPLKSNNDAGQKGVNRPTPEPALTMGEWRDLLLAEIERFASAETLNKRWAEERDRIEAATKDIRDEIEDALNDRLSDLIAAGEGGAAGAASSDTSKPAGETK